MQTHLKEWRQRRGLTQQALADLAGVTRQTISGIEAGLYGPGVEVALRLSRALTCRIEDLFQLSDTPRETAAVGVGTTDSGPWRVALAEISGRTIARPLQGLGAFRWPTLAAHGVAHANLGTGTVAVRELPRNGPGLFIAGCDPALGLLAAHIARGPGRVEALWWNAGNAEAAVQLERREVHCAAVHGPIGGSDPKAAFPLTRFRIGRWEMGWVVARGNPKAIREPEDLLRPDVRLANRETGAGARSLLDQLLTGAGIPAGRVQGYDRLFHAHSEIADAVALGVSDVGIAIGAAAAERGLEFLPLRTEVSDLLVPDDSQNDPIVIALLEALRSGPFRVDLGAFGSYDTKETGDLIA